MYKKIAKIEQHVPKWRSLKICTIPYKKLISLNEKNFLYLKKNIQEFCLNTCPTFKSQNAPHIICHSKNHKKRSFCTI